MYNLIPPIIIILCLGGILIIFLRKISLISRNVDSEITQSQENTGSTTSTQEEFKQAEGDNNLQNNNTLKSFEKIKTYANKIPERLRLEKIKYLVLQFLEKNLRKIKVWLMKIENIAADLTKKIGEKAKNFNKTEQNNNNSTSQETQQSSTPEPLPTEQQNQKIENPNKTNLESSKLNYLNIEQKKEFIEQEKEFIYRIAKNPGDIKSYLLLGNLYLNFKNYDDAAQSFRQIIKIDPNNKEAKDGLRKIEKRGNDGALWG